MSKQPITIWKNRIVNLEKFQDFDNGQGRAWKNALLLLLVVKKAYVLIHVEDITVA